MEKDPAEIDAAQLLYRAQATRKREADDQALDLERALDEVRAISRDAEAAMKSLAKAYPEVSDVYPDIILKKNGAVLTMEGGEDFELVQIGETKRYGLRRGQPTGRSLVLHLLKRMPTKWFLISEMVDILVAEGRLKPPAEDHLNKIKVATLRLHENGYLERESEKLHGNAYRYRLIPEALGTRIPGVATEVKR
jgi:hypothetical protein